MNEVKWLDKGWECPKCGAVMSPTTTVCINCTGFSGTSIATDYVPATDNKGNRLYADTPSSFNFQKEKGGE